MINTNAITVGVSATKLFPYPIWRDEGSLDPLEERIPPSPFALLFWRQLLAGRSQTSSIFPKYRGPYSERFVLRTSKVGGEENW